MPDIGLSREWPWGMEGGLIFKVCRIAHDFNRCHLFLSISSYQPGGGSATAKNFSIYFITHQPEI